MTITPRDYHDLTSAEQAEVDQIVASHLQPTGPDWDLPSGSGGHMPWLDDYIAAARPEHGCPSDPVMWTDAHGLGPSALPFLSRVLDGNAVGGHELIMPLDRMNTSFLQGPPRHWPRFEDHCEDELLYQGACERYNAETVVKRMSFVIVPGETPAEAAERIARKHIKPHGYFGQMCIFSGPGAVKPYGDHDAHYKNHPSSHPAHKLVMFRRGATFFGLPVCDECLYGDLDCRGWSREQLDRVNRHGHRVKTWHTGGGLVDDLAAHDEHGERVERAVVVDYTTDHDPETQRLRADDDEGH